MNERGKLTGLWRDAPVWVPRSADARPIVAADTIFPSARQAITRVFASRGMTRARRVALPEWSSHCVISAIGKCSMPVPIREVLICGIPIDGVLLYEQWGWPFKTEVYSVLTERFGEIPIVLDRVDSADFIRNRRVAVEENGAIVEIASLSKTLGFCGGGLARCGGEYLPFWPDASSGTFTYAIQWREQEAEIEERMLTFLKNESETFWPQLKHQIDDCDIPGAMALECRNRQSNLKVIASLPVGRGWPGWMHAAIEMGAAPGIAPLMLGEPIETIVSRQKEVRSRYRIETAAYHFDIAGNPLAPEYVDCLAFPVHGMVDSVDAILSDMVA